MRSGTQARRLAAGVLARQMLPLSIGLDALTVPVLTVGHGTSMFPGTLPLPLQIVSCNEKYQYCPEIKLDGLHVSHLGFDT